MTIYFSSHQQYFARKKLSYNVYITDNLNMTRLIPRNQNHYLAAITIIFMTLTLSRFIIF